MRPQNPDSPLARAFYWATTSFFLALAVRANDGHYSVAGILFLTLAISSAFLGAIFPVLPPGVPASRRTLHIALGAYALVFAAFDPFLLLLVLGISVPLGVIGYVLSNLRPVLRRSLFPIFLILITLVNGFSLWGAKRDEHLFPQFRMHARNDVQIFGEEAARALSAGQNPYSLRMPNWFGRDMPFYPPGTTGKDGLLPFGYPYMPLSALWSLPGYWLGDFRYSHLFAIIGAAALLAYARPSVTSKWAAMLFLLFPSTVFNLIMSWTEPVTLFFLAATVFCAYRAPRWLFVAFGCLLASKQYTFFLLALLPLMVPEKENWRPFLLKSVGIAALVTLPMALWDVEGFYRSAVQLHFKQPFRADSLSYLAALLKAGGPQLSPLFGFAALLGGLWVGTRKAQRDAASWCGAAALGYLGFFSFNKQAGANYYFWVFALLLAAVAVALPGEERNNPTSLAPMS